MIDGTAPITEFKDIAIEDLLGREPVDPIPELLSENISGKTVLVTGAGGSIGSELCRQIINLYPKKLLILDISELGIYNISSELEQQATKIGVQIYNLIGSVQDQNFIASIFKEYNIETIFHAAAYKHVPLMELNPIQAIKTIVWVH